MPHYDFYQHKECEFFTCHEGADPATFSCMFCYCPLYALGEKCGGNFTYTPDGIKDCSKCLKPHRRENYNGMCLQLCDVLELVRKKEEVKP